MHPLQLNFFLRSLSTNFLLIFGLSPCTVVKLLRPLRCCTRM